MFATIKQVLCTYQTKQEHKQVQITVNQAELRFYYI